MKQHSGERGRLTRRGLCYFDFFDVDRARAVRIEEIERFADFGLLFFGELRSRTGRAFLRGGTGRRTFRLSRSLGEADSVA